MEQQFDLDAAITGYALRRSVRPSVRPSVLISNKATIINHLDPEKFSTGGAITSKDTYINKQLNVH